jgi:hypothetical protein
VNAARTRQGGRYRPGRRRRANTAALTGLAAVIAVTFLLALAARAFVSRADCGSRPVVVNVAVSAEIGPAIQHVGQVFNDMHRHIAGRCASVVVRSELPAAVMAQLAGGKAGRHLPRVDAWIPDSGLWASLARASAARGRPVRSSGIRVARSALVIVMPRSAAAQFPAFGTSVSWKFLLPQAAGGPSSALGLNVRFPDPASSGTGLVALTELQRIFGGGGAAAASLANLLVHVQVVPPSEGLASLVAPTQGPGPVATPVTITTEQAVIQFDHAHPHQPLAVRYPSEGSDQLSYPYLLTATNRLTLSAAQQFGTVLQSRYAASYVRYLGFRSGNGAAGNWPSWYGLIKSAPRMLPQTTPGQASAALHAWQQDSLGSRDLTLIDVSSAMAARPTRGAPDLEQELSQAAGTGLARFPDSTQMGLWAFPSHINEGLPYEQLVPIGPLPAPLGLVTRRQQIEHFAQSARPLTSPAPLYSTILAAYQQMLGTYQPRYANTVVVLTAGVDRAPGDISPAALLGDLHVLYDPRRPVEIVVIMLGRSGDLHDLQQIAAATGGQATPITNPSQIAAVLGSAVAQQMCPPHCVG